MNHTIINMPPTISGDYGFHHTPTLRGSYVSPAVSPTMLPLHTMINIADPPVARPERVPFRLSSSAVPPVSLSNSIETGTLSRSCNLPSLPPRNPIPSLSSVNLDQCPFASAHLRMI
eukprot:TRINITY_DN1696_c0_g1_i2.p1 TRINITY_DN1696_c0_g1~~TRINITY_DN1696_c0_g1_i2.p1  ORF type:complete len:117 (+),score=14.02 TRINITY_DN1696_c0_g1_i2:133-483(+)